MSTAELAKAETLRQYLRSGQLDALTALPQLIEGAAATLAKGRPPGEPAAKAGEWVFLLAQALRAQRDPALSARLFQALVLAGRLGRAFASQYIQSRPIPLALFAPMLQSLPAHNFLALLNDMLLNAPAEDKQFAAWLRSLLPAPGRLDLREALLFLKALTMPMSTPLARPLRESLLAAGVGTALTKAFAGSPGAAMAEALLLAAEVLPLPDVQSAALAYALRTAGGGGPSRLGPLLAAPPDLEPRDTALAAEMRGLALGPDPASHLLAAARTEPETLGLVLAGLMQNGGQQAVASLRLTPLLPRLGVLSCLDALPEHMHMMVYARLLECIATLRPDFLTRCAKAFGTNLDPRTAQAVAEMLNLSNELRAGRHPDSPFNLHAWKSAPLLPVGPDPAAPKNGKDKRSTLAECLRPGSAPLKDADLRNASLADETLDGLVLSGGTLSRCRFSGVRFAHVRINATQMAQCQFENCQFTDCAFAGADLSHSQFTGCRFQGCSFDACDLSRTRILGCSIMGCALTETSVAGGALDKSRLDALTFRACALSGMRLRECSLVRLSFALSELSGGLWDKCICRDSLWQACALSRMRLLDCECVGLSLARSSATELEVLGGHTDSPDLAQARRATRARLLESVLADPAPLAPALREGAGAQFVRACVDLHLRVDEAEGTLAAMRGQDQRRRELALERLTEPQGQLLRLLPALLATDVFERAQGLEAVPACAISGHTRPGVLPREARAGLERLFPGVVPTPRPAPALFIEAVYAIGSLGSVAQKPSSDVDCWVCLGQAPGAAPAPPAQSGPAREGLARKLAALETFAWEQCGLEVHLLPHGPGPGAPQRFRHERQGELRLGQAAL